MKRENKQNVPEEENKCVDEQQEQFDSLDKNRKTSYPQPSLAWRQMKYWHIEELREEMKG